MLRPWRRNPDPRQIISIDIILAELKETAPESDTKIGYIDGSLSYNTRTRCFEGIKLLSSGRWAVIGSIYFEIDKMSSTLR
jgi:hypothetical protein